MEDSCSHLDLSVNRNVRLDLPLRLGTTTQAVTVTESVNADSLAQENVPFAGNTAIFNGRIENPFGSLLTPPPATPTGRRVLRLSIATTASFMSPAFHFASKGTTYERTYVPTPRSNTSHHSVSAARIQGL